MHAKYFQLYLALCDPMGCSLPGSTVQGILQAKILEWVAKKQNIDTYNMNEPKIHLPSKRSHIKRLDVKEHNLYNILDQLKHRDRESMSGCQELRKEERSDCSVCMRKFQGE